MDLSLLKPTGFEEPVELIQQEALLLSACDKINIRQYRLLKKWP